MLLVTQLMLDFSLKYLLNFLQERGEVIITNAQFKLEKFEYTYDYKAQKIFRSKKIMNFLSYFLCNIKSGMNITSVKE